LEARSCELPVVGGNPEVVVAGETAILMPSADLAALARAMLLMDNEGNSGRAMGLAGRQRVAPCFEISRMAAE
jgi:glycosyltransferase involved in cell wall biosynthesis